mmetsp:Transcript_20321/g.47760  ORF Transcript_20321/g.47760 Transcript_20321/m.47760 type:complete len:221 (-) Transcript_20321:777-1439(-)
MKNQKDDPKRPGRTRNEVGLDRLVHPVFSLPLGAFVIVAGAAPPFVVVLLSASLRPVLPVLVEIAPDGGDPREARDADQDEEDREGPGGRFEPPQEPEDDQEQRQDGQAGADHGADDLVLRQRRVPPEDHHVLRADPRKQASLDRPVRPGQELPGRQEIVDAHELPGRIDRFEEAGEELRPRAVLRHPRVRASKEPAARHQDPAVGNGTRGVARHPPFLL